MGRRRSRVRLVLLAALVMLALPASHSLGGPPVQEVDLSAGSAMCVPARGCVSDVDCAPRYCRDFGPGLGFACADPIQDLYCCESGVCPTVEGTVGTCLDVGGTADPIAVCVYFYMENLCVRPGQTSVPESLLRACFSGGTAWDDGDCDGDGTRNADDSSVCPVLSAMDAGPPAGEDAGPERDAGGSDAGEPTRDAETPGFDAGSANGDAGATGFRFGGGAGCGCSVPGAMR